MTGPLEHKPVEEYYRWLERLSDFPKYLEELEDIGREEVYSRFGHGLEFGTGGLRGEIGMGPARMNIFTVERATQGLAEYLLSNNPEPSAVIAYDTRNMSREFAQHTACVLCANGVKTYLYDSTRPTPMLSFAVRYLGADAGIVITASHNPKQYNGYKVYGSDGGQITDRAAAAIFERICKNRFFDGVKSIPWCKAVESGLLRTLSEDVDAEYYEKVKALCLRREFLLEEADKLKILYTPLHGSGNIPVRRVLGELGFRIDIVREQELPDGDFPTASIPNPEEPEVFRLALERAKETAPDLILATDPDCDRIGVMCKADDGEYKMLTGNQLGVLLCDYILRTRMEFGSLPENAAIVKTIVTTDMSESVCRRYGVHSVDVLTGFKYIGEKIGEWEKNREHSFIFGFEESFGYLAGDFVRDKDAVIASALISEMVLYHKENGLTLIEALRHLYEEHGFYSEKLITIATPGRDGKKWIAALFSKLRSDLARKFEGMTVSVVEDYETSIRTFYETGERECIYLPKSNVLKIIYRDGSRLTLRPSGTEPKIKFYIGVKADSEIDARIKTDKLANLTAVLAGGEVSNDLLFIFGSG